MGSGKGMNLLLSEIVLWLAPILPQEVFMPGSFPQIVQITMSLWDTTADEIAHFRESRALVLGNNPYGF
jgi:hypothetical protein